MSLFDIEDEAALEKLATKKTEKKLTQRKNKRLRRTRSTDHEGDEDMIEDSIDDDVSIEMLNQVKAELMKAFQEAVTKVDKRLDAAYGRIGGNENQIKANKEKIEVQSREIANLQNELQLLRQDSHDSFAKVKDDMKKAQKEASDAKREAETISAEAMKLKAERKQNIRRMVDLEARSRRNNLIFYGIPEADVEVCEDKIIQFLKENLKVEINPSAVQRAHRLGRPRSKNNIGKLAFTPRPMIVLFTDFKLKEAIRKKRFELTRPYGISDDLPVEIRRARKSLENVVKDLKAQNKKVAIIYPCRLLINGEIDRTTNVDIADFSNEQ